MKKKIALLGGSFDPVHNGHIAMADAALKHLGVEEVWFIPALQSPLKDHALTRTSDRLNMLRTVCRDHPRFKICDVDLRRHGVSYTVDTLEILTRNFPDFEFIWLLGEDQADQFDHWKNPERLRELARFARVRRHQPQRPQVFDEDGEEDGMEQNVMSWPDFEDSEMDGQALLLDEEAEKAGFENGKEEPGEDYETEVDEIFSEILLGEEENLDSEKEIDLKPDADGFLPLPMEPVDVSSTEIRHGRKLNCMPESIRQYLLDHEMYLVQWIQPQMSAARFAHSNSVARLCRQMARAHGFDRYKIFVP